MLLFVHFDMTHTKAVRATCNGNLNIVIGRVI